MVLLLSPPIDAMDSEIMRRPGSRQAISMREPAPSLKPASWREHPRYNLNPRTHSALDGDAVVAKLMTLLASGMVELEESMHHDMYVYHSLFGSSSKNTVLESSESSSTYMPSKRQPRHRQPRMATYSNNAQDEDGWQVHHPPTYHQDDQMEDIKVVEDG